MKAKAICLNRCFIVFYPDKASKYADRYKLMRYPKIRVSPSTAELLGKQEYSIGELTRAIRIAASSSSIHQRRHWYKRDLERLNDFIRKLQVDEFMKPSRRPSVSRLTYPISMFRWENKFYEVLELHSTPLVRSDVKSDETGKIIELMRKLSSDSGKFFGLSNPLNDIAVAIFKRSVYTVAFFPHYLVGASLSPYRRVKKLKINRLKPPHHLSKDINMHEFEAVRDHPYSLTFILLDLLQSLKPVNSSLRDTVKKEAARICLEAFLQETFDKGELNYLFKRMRESYQKYFPSTELIRMYAVMRATSNFDQSRESIMV